MTANRSFLEWQVSDASMRFLSAPPEMKLHRAQLLVEAKFARGDYPELQALDTATRDNLAKAMVEQLGRGTPKR